MRVVMRRTHHLRVLLSPLLASKKAILCDLLWGLNDRLAINLIKIRDLVDEINSLRFKMDQKLAKLARAEGVAHSH
jgi:hypothetical protein